MDYIDRKLIVLNSKDAQRQNGAYLSSLLFPFTDILKRESDIKYATIGLLSAEIPVSFYNININNQVLKCTISSVAYTVTIPESNYNSTTFIAAFQAQFLATTGRSIDLTISKLTGKLTFTLSGYTLILLTSSTIYEVLGLEVSTTYTISSTLISPYMCNLLGIKKLKVISSALSNGSLDSLGNSTILQTISVDQPAYGLISYQNNDANFAILKSKTISNIDLEIRDENNKLIDLNGIHFSITLVLNIHRISVPNIDDTIKVESIQMKALENVSTPKILKSEERQVPDKDLEELKFLTQNKI